MDGSSTALPNEWISRLFRRFRSIYGNKVDVMYGSTATDPKEAARQMADLTATWAAELGRYEVDDLKRALEAMRFAYKEFPPTCYQFADLCRDAARARAQLAGKIEHVRYGAPVAQVLAAIHELTQSPLQRRRDPRDWARKILQRDRDGERVPIYALQCAKEALDIGRPVRDEDDA